VDIKEAAHIDAAEHSDGDIAGADNGSTARRRILVAGLSGTALSLVPFLARRAGATGTKTSTAGATPGGNTRFSGTGDSTNPSSDVTSDATSDATSDVTTGDSTDGSTADTEAATTTTAPPKRPTADDVVLLSFAQSMELTSRDLYDVAIGSVSFDQPTLEAVKSIREAHEAYAQAISGMLGRVAPNTRLDELFTAMKPDFTGNVDDVATTARALENTAIATHTDILGELVGIDGAALIASMLVVEARHATVLASVAGVTKLDDQLAGDADPLSPSDYSTK